MDIQSLKSLLELQALQSLGTDQNTSTATSNNSSMFSNMIEEVLENATSSSTLDISNMLGSVSSGLDSNKLSQLTNNSVSGPLASNPYLASLMYANSNSSIADFTQKTTSTNNLPTSIENYTSTDFTGTTAFENVLAGATKYADTIAAASAKYDVPEKLIAAVMKQESNFNPSAVSSAGATGLMQLMPATAKYLGVDDSKNPQQNIMGGAKYLRQMLDKFDNNISTALAAYNAGPGNVKKYGGIPPFKETQNYVKKVMNYYQT